MTDHPTDTGTEKLLSLIKRRCEVLLKLRELTVRQVAFVEQGEMEPLLGVLAAKNTLLEEFQRLERELDPFRDQDPARRVWRSKQLRAKTRELVETCERLLGEIIEIERRCSGQLADRRDAVAERLQGAHTAAFARAAYVEPEAGRVSQLDLRSEDR